MADVSLSVCLSLSICFVNFHKVWRSEVGGELRHYDVTHQTEAVNPDEDFDVLTLLSPGDEATALRSLPRTSRYQIKIRRATPAGETVSR